MTVPTRITAGSRIGTYEIKSQLGEGGMGVVFRAHDTKLQRDVALKLLPEHLAGDPDRLSRLQREALVLASLNHTNIAQIYGLEDSTFQRCIVMELVEGETLASRLKRGALPTAEALQIARQIAEALEAAHEKGIVHRDLKPGNVMLTAGGKVKVLDFGLARTSSSPAAGSDLSNSPTLSNISAPGVILGTAAYMAPEQARGNAADNRSDLWAFGCVLFEMLAGASAFTGDTTTDILARIMTTDPDWKRLPAGVPPEIQWLLRRCLQKDRNRRLHHVVDARIEIESVLSQPAAEVTAAEALHSPSGRNRRLLPWIVAGASVVLLIVVSLFFFLPNREVSPELRLDVTTPPTADPYSLTMSPDGRRISFVGNADEKSMLLIRDLDSTVVRPIPGTEGAAFPFWSPDGRYIGFFADSKLKVVDIAGGVPQVLAAAPTPRGGTWNSAGTIVFAPGVGPLSRVRATGGDATVFTKLEPPLGSHRFPYFLPDGRHFLLYGQGNSAANGVYVSDLDGAPPKRLLSADAGAVYGAGHLLFIRQGTLFAQAFDLDGLEIRGDPVRVADKVNFTATVLAAPLATSRNGAIAYRAGSGVAARMLWFDRSGKQIGLLGDADSLNPNSPELSPDEKHVALFRSVNSNVDVWTIETSRNVTTPVTSDAGNDINPIFSPDGKWIVFGSTRNGPYNLFRKLTNGAGPEELLLQSSQNKIPTDWSSDGRYILYRETDVKSGYDLWAAPVSGDKKSIPISTTPNEERDGQFSPDVRWVAYSSNASGRAEIYVQPFPGPGGRVTVSTSGGAQPRWRHDGKEIFYVAPDNSLMSVPLKLSADGSAIEPGTPAPLFRTRFLSNVAMGGKQQYDVTRDGQRFLAIVAPDDAAASPITLLLNWKQAKDN